MKLLVIGASGLLGGEVCRQGIATGVEVVGTYDQSVPDLPVRVERLDIRDQSTVSSLIAAELPDAVVNAASRYDGWSVTADGAAHVAVACAAVGARLVHVSSDAVHGGRSAPYTDDEPPSPVYTYGAAKAAAETAVRVADPLAALVRTSLIVGGEQSKHVAFCLDLLRGHRSGVLLADDIRCPIAVEDLAAALLELAGTPYAGLLNVAGPEAVSRPEFGQLVAERYRLDPAALKVSTIAESGLVRPDRVVLDSGRAAEVLSIRPRPVSQVLRRN